MLSQILNRTPFWIHMISHIMIQTLTAFIWFLSSWCNYHMITYDFLYNDASRICMRMVSAHNVVKKHKVPIVFWFNCVQNGTLCAQLALSLLCQKYYTICQAIFVISSSKIWLFTSAAKLRFRICRFCQQSPTMRQSGIAIVL